MASDDQHTDQQNLDLGVDGAGVSTDAAPKKAARKSEGGGGGKVSGQYDANAIQVLEGLESGATIVTSGAGFLKDGDRVNVAGVN